MEMLKNALNWFEIPVTDFVGHMAIFLDTEGNRVALHSNQ